MVFINSLQELSELWRLPTIRFEHLTVLSSDDFSIDKLGHVAAMNFVESIVVDVLHAMVNDRSSENVTNVGECIENFDQITRTGCFSILLNFFC